MQTREASQLQELCLVPFSPPEPRQDNDRQGIHDSQAGQKPDEEARVRHGGRTKRTGRVKLRCAGGSHACGSGGEGEV
jgi:hypothetical protein